MRDLLYSFNGGEVSPSLSGRTDLPGIKRMCRKMRGFIAAPTGAAYRRPSLLHCQMALSNGSWLIPFNAGDEATFMLECADLTLRVLTTGGTVVTSLVAPWTAAQVSRLQFVQSNDVMWIVHGEVPVQELRREPTGWVLVPMPWAWPPLRTENLTAITITPSATTGDITLLASGPIFDLLHVGAYWQISHFRETTSIDYSAPVTPPASAILNLETNPADGEVFSIGAVVYTFKTAPAQPYEVKRHATDTDLSRGYAVDAVNGSGTLVVPGTLPHPQVTATDGGTTTSSVGASATLTINVGPVNGVPFSNLIPGQSITVNGTAFFCVSSGATSGQFNLGASQEATLDNFIVSANLLTGTTGVTFAARSGRSTVASYAPGVAGNAIAVGSNTAGLPWLLWTDSTGAATSTLKGGTDAATERMKITARQLGEEGNGIIVSTNITDGYWSGATVDGNIVTTGGSETDAVSESITIKGAWTFTTIGRWEGIVYIETQDAAGNWQILRQFNGRLDINRTAAGIADVPTVFRIRVKDLAGAASSEAPNGPRFILEAAESIVHGLVQITGVTDTTHADATVISQLQSTDPTPNWREGAFSAFRGYPAATALHEERLIFAGVISEPQKVWGSGAGDFRDFEETGLADASWQWPFTSQTAFPIRALVSSRGLVIFTGGNERVWDSGEQGITPMNPPLQRQLTYSGSEAVMPAAVGDVVVFVGRGSRAIREYGYELNSQSYIAPDLTQLVDHLTVRGIVSLAISRSPFQIVWAVTGDGKLLACTYERREEVVAWCPQNVNGTVLCVAAIPGASGQADHVWIVVQRAHGTALERFDPTHWTALGTVPGTTASAPVHMDSAVSDTNIGGTLNGLDHLEGQTVQVFADGVPLPPRTVIGGRIEVPAQYNLKLTWAGLNYTSELQPALYDFATQLGVSTGKKYNVRRMHVRFYQTRAASYKNDDTAIAQVFPVEIMTAEADTSQGPPVLNGTKQLQVEGNFAEGINTVIFSDSPHPLNILNMVPEFTITGQ